MEVARQSKECSLPVSRESQGWKLPTQIGQAGCLLLWPASVCSRDASSGGTRSVAIRRGDRHRQRRGDRAHAGFEELLLLRDREITLMLDGYQTKTVIQPIKAPWWDNYLTEFFTENLISDLDARRARIQVPTGAGPIADAGRAAQSRRGPCEAEAQDLPKPRRGGILGWLGF